MLKIFNLFILLINQITEHIGKIINGFALLMALITLLIVVTRYGFNTGSIALQESVIYLHASLFLLGIAYTLKHDGHVRVDIFYHTFSKRKKAWLDSVGAIIFLLPLSAFIGLVTWNSAIDSWAIKEASADTGGIPAVFLLKSLPPLAALLLFLQGLAETFKNILILIEERDDDELSE